MRRKVFRSYLNRGPKQWFRNMWLWCFWESGVHTESGWIMWTLAYISIAVWLTRYCALSFGVSVGVSIQHNILGNGQLQNFVTDIPKRESNCMCYGICFSRTNLAGNEPGFYIQKPPTPRTKLRLVLYGVPCLLEDFSVDAGPTIKTKRRFKTKIKHET